MYPRLIFTRCPLAAFIMLTITTTNFGVEQQINVSAPLMTDSTAKSSASALKSVVRVVCPSTDHAGTGFLHLSGWIITAAHVVLNCKSEEILVFAPDGNQFKVADQRVDQ